MPAVTPRIWCCRIVLGTLAVLLQGAGAQTAPAPRLLSERRPVIGSWLTNGGGPAKTNDGRRTAAGGDVWRANGEGWLEFDLGQSAAVQSVVIRPFVEQGLARLEDFRVYVRDKPFFSDPDAQGDLKWQQHKGSTGTLRLPQPRDGRYVRLQLVPYQPEHDRWHPDQGLESVVVRSSAGLVVPIRRGWGTGERGGDTGDDLAHGRRWMAGRGAGYVELELERGALVAEVELASWWDWGAHARGVRVWVADYSMFDTIENPPALQATMARGDKPQTFALERPAVGRYVSLFVRPSAAIQASESPFYAVREIQVWGQPQAPAATAPATQAARVGTQSGRP